MSPLHTFSELGEYEVDPRSVQLLDEPFCRQRQVVVLGRVNPRSEEPVTVGMVDLRSSQVHDVAAALQREVTPVRLNSFEVGRALDIGWGLPDPAAQRSVLTLEPVDRLSFHADDDAPKLLDELLSVAIQSGASDLHIESYPEDIDVRLRVDGILRQLATPLSRANIDSVIARLKVLADLDIAERRRDQDGRLRATFKQGREERPVDIRLSIVPGPGGEDAVLRILDRHRGVMTLEDLGLASDVLATFEELIANPEGLVLVTGPTGSGKTTTLYSALHRINSAENKILTAENPIEYFFAKTNQKQVSAQMGFAAYARAFLRQDPDIILIGEVRDDATAATALDAAQTGHLVLSTLHANDAVRTVSRLESLGAERHMLASCLLGSLAQRLVRRICPHCREQVEPSDRQARRLGLEPGETFYRGRGCDACEGRGSKGRTGIYELFVLDAELADMVAEGAATHLLRERALAKGMRTLRDDALAKAREGVVGLDELLRVLPYRLLQDRG